MILEEVFSPKAICVDLSSDDKDEVIEELVELFAAEHPEVGRSEIIESVFTREEKMSTGIMHNIAVPHGRTSAVKGIHGVIGISRTGIDFDSLDGAPVTLFIMLISSQGDNELHLRALKRVSQLLEKETFYKDILEQKTPGDVYNVLCRYEEELVAI